MIDLEWTGERVIPEKMADNRDILLEHIARYKFACRFCKDKEVLDAACGSGYGAKILQGVANSVEGVDIDRKTIEYARERYPDIDFYICDLNKGFPCGFYDVIVSFETIEHLSNPDYFLERVSESCKEFIFSIPLNNPSKFHKHVYSLELAQSQIYEYFNIVEWFGQKGVELLTLGLLTLRIFPFKEQSRFLIGVARVGK